MPEEHVEAVEVDDAVGVLDLVLSSGDESAEVVHPGEDLLYLPYHLKRRSLRLSCVLPHRLRLGTINSIPYSSAKV